MSFNMFEAAVGSEQEQGIAKQAATDKLAAAIYDVREKLGGFLFQADSLENFRDRVAMVKNDQSVYKIIEAHTFPAAGTVRRIVGKNSALEQEFKAILATGTRTADFDGSMDIKKTFKPSDDELIPDGDFDSYLNKVDQNSDKVDRNFAASVDFQVYADWCKAAGYQPMRLASLDVYGSNLDDARYLRLARTIQAWEFEHKPKTPSTKLKKKDKVAKSDDDDWEFDHKPSTPKGQSKSKLKDVTAGGLFNRHSDPHDPKSKNYNPAGYYDENHQPGSIYSGPRGEMMFDGEDDTDYFNKMLSNRRQAGPNEYGDDDDYMGLDTGNEGGGSGIIDKDTSHSGGPGGYPTAKRRKAGPSSYGGDDDYMGLGSELPDTGRHHQHHIDRETTSIGGPGSYPQPAPKQSDEDRWHQKELERMMGKGRGSDPNYKPQHSRGWQADPMVHSYASVDHVNRYVAWCKRNGYKRISARNVEIYSRGNPELTMQLAARMKAAIHTARSRKTGCYPGCEKDEKHAAKFHNKQARRRQAAPDYLQKADDALTQLLNQKAEEFQQTIAPMQQALVTVQQAIQLQQQANPLNVLPAPGTVNVMPGQAPPGQVGMPDPSGGQDPSAAAAAALASPPPPGGDPSGGDPSAAGGPPPAAAAGGALPPDQQQQMMQAKRGGRGKGRGATRPRQSGVYQNAHPDEYYDQHHLVNPNKMWNNFHELDAHGQGAPKAKAIPQGNVTGLNAALHSAAGVLDLWNKWQQNRGQTGNLGIGGDADYQNFQQEYGIGDRALNKLKTHHQTGVTVGAKTPNAWEDGVKDQWRQMDSSLSAAGYKFDKSSQHWHKPGTRSVKNPWPISAGKHDYNRDDPNQIFAPSKGYGWEHKSGPSGSPYVRPQNDEDYEGHPLPHKHEGARKQAWTGWGPAQFPRTRQVEGWQWDNHLNGYKSNQPGHFACECGHKIAAPSGFYRCSCGKSWNSYVIGGVGGTNHEASSDQYLVREIPTRHDVIVANKQLLADLPPQGFHEQYQQLPGPPDGSGKDLHHFHDWPTDKLAKYHQFLSQTGDDHHALSAAQAELDKRRQMSAKTLIDPRTGGIVNLIDPGEVGEGQDPGTPSMKSQPADWAKRGDGAKWIGSPIG